jgi:hypothetical protein
MIASGTDSPANFPSLSNMALARAVTISFAQPHKYLNVKTTSRKSLSSKHTRINFTTSFGTCNRAQPTLTAFSTQDHAEAFFFS